MDVQTEGWLACALPASFPGTLFTSVALGQPVLQPLQAGYLSPALAQPRQSGTWVKSRRMSRASPSSHSIMSPPHHAEVRIRNPISQMRPLRIRGSYASHTLGSLRALRRVSTYHLFTIQSQQNVSPQVLCPTAQPEQDKGDHGKQLQALPARGLVSTASHLNAPVQSGPTPEALLKIEWVANIYEVPERIPGILCLLLLPPLQPAHPTGREPCLTHPHVPTPKPSL